MAYNISHGMKALPVTKVDIAHSTNLQIQDFRSYTLADHTSGCTYTDHCGVRQYTRLCAQLLITSDASLPASSVHAPCLSLATLYIALHAHQGASRCGPNHAQ